MSLACITIDLPALRHNFLEIKSRAPESQVLAMIKANAYGHGIEQIATALPEVDAFGVASLSEGLLIRAAGVTKPVVLMQGVLDEEEFIRAIQNNFDLIIHQPMQVEILKQYHERSIAPVSVWLKIDTGMNRLGFEPADALVAYQELMNCQAVKKPLGLMTHLAEADNLNSPKTMFQLKSFGEVTLGLTGPRSIANSAGILGWPASHADWIRPGILLYGVSPFIQSTGADYNLRPVMTFSTHLIAIQGVKKYECIGYGATWTAPEDMLIGVAGLGYADGYPQFAKAGTPISVEGIHCPLVGRVSMDMITMDLRNHPNPKVGDSVVLWGKGLPIETVARHCDTSPYELLCRVTTRARVKTRSLVDAL